MEASSWISLIWVGLYIFLGFLALIVVGAVFLLLKYRFGQGGKTPALNKNNNAAGGVGQGGRVGRREGNQEWFNQMVAWLHSHHLQLNENWKWITDACVKSLSDEIKSHAPPELTIRLDGTHKLGSEPPEFTDFTTDGSSAQALVVKADFSLRDCSMLAYVISHQSNNTVSVKCDVKVHHLKGQIAAKIDEDREAHAKMTVSFDSKPNISLEVVPQNGDVELDRYSLERVIIDAFSRIAIQIPLSSPDAVQTGNQNMEIFETCEQVTQNHMLQATRPGGRSRKKLLVKIIKANGLVDAGTNEPFCVVNTDSPIQREETSSVGNTAHPFFDEHFLFDLNSSTKMVSFELHNRKDNIEGTLLGRAELTMDEVNRSEKSRHVLPLTGQSTTYGSLTVEVTTVDEEVERSSSLTPNVQHISSNLHPSNSMQRNRADYLANNTQHLSAHQAATLDSGYNDILQQGKYDTMPIRGGGAPPNINSIPRIETLPPKGDSKRTSFATAIKNRFRRKKEPRSKSADRPEKQKYGASSEGIYLTPPPSRPAGAPSGEYSQGGINDDGKLNRSRSNSIRTSLKRLFQRKEKSGSRASNSRDSNPSREGSTGHPSPVLPSHGARSLQDDEPTRSRTSTISNIL